MIDLPISKTIRLAYITFKKAVAQCLFLAVETIKKKKALVISEHNGKHKCVYTLIVIMTQRQQR